MRCADCGCEVFITEKTLRRGSAVREPGEPVCPSDLARRNKMVRELEAIPASLDRIKAMRMRRGIA